MTYADIVLQGLSRRFSQIALTFACLFVTFLLLGLLLSLRQAFTANASVESSYRLRSNGASSLAASFPVHYARTVSKVKGVESVVYVTATPAAYQDDPRHLLLQAVSVSGFFPMFPELHVDSGQRNDFETDKTAMLAGQEAVDRYGWKLGQSIALQTNVPNRDGGASWTFHLRGIYKSDDPKIPDDLTFVHYGYLNDARVQGKDQVIGLIERVNDPSRAEYVASQIDARFATSTPRLRTQPENAAVQKQLAQFGDFNAIVMVVAGIVFVSMLLLSHNVWHERIQARLHEFATMKAVGFRRRIVFLLVVGEALTLTVPAAIAGLLAAAAIVAAVRPAVSPYLGGFYFPLVTYIEGMLAAIAFALVYSIPPALRAAGTPLSKLSRASS